MSDINLASNELPDAQIAAALPTSDPDLEWRMAEMLDQLSDVKPGDPLPTLTALPDCRPNPEDCPSCGELRDVGEAFLCDLCARAKALALDLWMDRQ